MKIVIDEGENFNCDNLALLENNVISYDDKQIDAVNDYTIIDKEDKWVCENKLGKIKIVIPLTVPQISDKNYSVYIDYEYHAGEYKIILDANGGTIPETDGWSGTDEIVTKNIKYDSIYGPLPTPTRDKYTFNGWFSEETNGTEINENDKYLIVGDQTLYAHWKEATLKCYMCVEHQYHCIPDVGTSWIDGTCYYESKTGKCNTGWRAVPSNGITGCPSGTSGGGGGGGGGSCKKYLCCRNDNADFCTYSTSGSMSNYTCACWEY